MSTASTKPMGRGRYRKQMVCACTLIAISLLQDEAGAQAAHSTPDFPGQVMLIKNTIVAVNHGNLTGNYTVLRDLASARFREQNTAADLAITFANLRQQQLDLSPILVAEPQLTQKPAEDQFRDRLQLVGYFATLPQAVRFALIFQHIRGGWVIDEISVAIAPIESVVQTQRAAPITPHSQPTPVRRIAQPGLTLPKPRATGDSTK